MSSQSGQALVDLAGRAKRPLEPPDLEPFVGAVDVVGVDPETGEHGWDAAGRERGGYGDRAAASDGARGAGEGGGRGERAAASDGERAHAGGPLDGVEADPEGGVGRVHPGRLA